jgi:hypothetical protein
MPPLAEPLSSILKPMRQAADGVRHRFPRPEALENLQCGFRKLAQMPVDNPHVRNAGVQGREAILCGPGALASTESSIRDLATVATARSWEFGKNPAKRSKEARVRTNRKEKESF